MKTGREQNSEFRTTTVYRIMSKIVKIYSLSRFSEYLFGNNNFNKKINLEFTGNFFIMKHRKF